MVSHCFDILKHWARTSDGVDNSGFGCMKYLSLLSMEITQKFGISFKKALNTVTKTKMIYDNGNNSFWYVKSSFEVKIIQARVL